MDWSVEDIESNAFTHYELDNESRSLSGYHVFTRCAFEGYKVMDESARLTFIMATHNLEDEGILDDDEIADMIDSSDFQAIRVVRGMWRNASSQVKEAWKQRAEHLNARPQVGQVEELPESLAILDLRSIQDRLRNYIKTDLQVFSKMIKRSLRNENQREMNHKKVQFPYPIEVKKQIYRSGTVSSLLLEVLFGVNRNQLLKSECISNQGSDPFTYHIFSEARLRKLLTFQDTEISILKDNCEGSKTSLCAYGVVLKNNTNQSTKAYAISETKSTVTFIFADETVQTRSLTFPKPTLIKENEPRAHYTGYKCGDEVVHGWKLIQFNPACLYLSSKNTNNFKLLASKVCIKEETNRINTNRST